MIWALKYFTYFLIIFTFPIFSDSVSFGITKKNILKGEPLYAQFEIKTNDDVEIQVPNQVYSDHGVSAEYLGLEDSISIINGKYSKKKIVKFRVVTSKDGDLETPKISILVNGETRTSDKISFHVSKDKFKPKRGDPFFGNFFGEDSFPFQERAYVEPGEDDLVILFSTNRNKVYLGEVLVGHFELLYKNIYKPQFQRSERKPLEFPFFVSEFRQDLMIKSPGSANYKNNTYNVLPYHPDVYMLTPQKTGKFSLGSCYFGVQGGFTSFFSEREIPTVPKTVTVLPLPEPKPEKFNGEVGEYSVKITSDQKEESLGNPVRYNIIITGAGSGLLLKDPYSDYCSKVKNCEPANLLDKSENKKLEQFSDNDYRIGYEGVFKYSFQPKQTGKFRPESFKFTFFNSEEERYQTVIADFPSVQIKEKIIIKKEDSIKEEPSFFQKFDFGLLFKVLLLGAFSYVAFSFRKELLGFIIKKTSPLLGKYKLFPGLSSKKLEALDRFCGGKKGILLKNYLLDRGWGKGDAEELVRFQRNHPGLKFGEIYFVSSESEKQVLDKLAEKIKIRR